MFDATLITAHSDKESAAPNFKGGYGFHPLTAWLDNTSEALAAVLRPGNSGSNTALVPTSPWITSRSPTGARADL